MGGHVFQTCPPWEPYADGWDSVYPNQLGEVVERCDDLFRVAVLLFVDTPKRVRQDVVNDFVDIFQLFFL